MSKYRQLVRYRSRRLPSKYHQFHGKKVRDDYTGFWTYEAFLVQDERGMRDPRVTPLESIQNRQSDIRGDTRSR